ncbi:hypothetical protein BGZ94_004228 [Podila epigama]|nr:hypothetical protein BGZ94_004228 [Podila epigama]
MSDVHVRIQTCGRAQAVSVAATYSSGSVPVMTTSIDQSHIDTSRTTTIKKNSNSVYGRGEQRLAKGSGVKTTPMPLILAEFAVTRVDIGSFRNVKTSARETSDYCRCIVEQEGDKEGLEKPQPQQQKRKKKQQQHQQQQQQQQQLQQPSQLYHAPQSQFPLLPGTRLSSNQISLWLCLACGGPALRVTEDRIRSIARPTTPGIARSRIESNVAIRLKENWQKHARSTCFCHAWRMQVKSKKWFNNCRELFRQRTLNPPLRPPHLTLLRAAILCPA